MELREMIQSADIVSYISQFVDLEQRGDEFWGLSPFKEEKTPSFSVRPDPPCFYDYSSGIGGNIFTFIRYYFHCSKHEAVKKLESYSGKTADKYDENGKLDATRVCQRFKSTKTPQKCSKDTVLSEDTLLRYEKRPDKLKIWRDEGISDESMARFQVFYDPFSNRLVYPIRNQSGSIVNVGGRTLDPDWKAKKLRKYTYFYPWNNGMNIIYGLFENFKSIKQQHEIILFEGAKSVMLADSFGIKNTGALLTSHISTAQFRILAALGCRVVLALDNDVDITKDHNAQKLKRYVHVSYLHDDKGILDEKDSPVDKGKEVFVELLQNRRRLL